MNNAETTDKRIDKILFTPGPLTTSMSVKQAMLRDLGSRDLEFIKKVKEIRNSLLDLAGVKKGNYEAVLMQGSGTFGIESVISSVIPEDGKLLTIINGAYGERIDKIAKKLKIETVNIIYDEDKTPCPDSIEEVLNTDNEITHVAIIQCETTTGIFNPVKEIGNVVARAGKKYIVDAMSSFGALPVDLDDCKIDYIISSSNKCIEGVPGFSFVIAKTESLLETKNYARSISLDLYAQWEGLEKNGQFRFTPPTHSLLAFHQALTELQKAGGITSRAERYKNNNRLLIENMRKLGFREYLSEENQGYIITSFYYPEDDNFDFTEFYETLNTKGFVIYPGKLTKVNCFRIGNIGKIYEQDILDLIAAIEETLTVMNIDLKN